MGENFKYIFIAGIAAVFITGITREIRKTRKRKGQVIVSAVGGVNSNLVFGCIWFVCCLIWTILLSQRTREIYYLLNKEYISSVFQLLDLEKLKSLQQYFYEQQMLRELNGIVFYRANIPATLGWIILSALNSILGFYRGWQKDLIYDQGAVVSGNNMKWDKIVGFEWGALHGGKWHNGNKDYYDLYLIVRHGKLAKKIMGEDTHEVQLSISSEDKEITGKFLTTVIEQIET